MIKAVLFDLDGTLLPMDNNVFTEHYMKLLGLKFYELGYDPKLAIKGIWNGLTYMIKNDGSYTNEEIFWKGFCEVIDIEQHQSKDELSNLLLGFYQNEFHQARSATLPNDEAKQLIAYVKAKGFKVILATNPIFPKEAVVSRLSWINLTEHDFDAITTYETSHFSKPNPQYYEEILRNNALSPQECVMIGNDVKEDIVAASSLQIKTFLVQDHQLGEEEGIPTEKGSFHQITDFISSLN